MSQAPIAFARRDGRAGANWLKRAYGMFRLSPLRWLMLLFSYYLLVSLSEFGPWRAVGQFIAPILKPVFAVGFLAAAWSQERGNPPRFAYLFRGFRSNLFALIPLGLVFVAGMSIAVLATMLVDGGKLISLLAGAEKPSEDALAAGQIQLAMLFGVACALPTLLALWFAPALVVFDDAGALRALETSLRAALANWRPIAMYSVVVFALGGVVPGLLLFTVAELLGEFAAGVLTFVVVLPYLFAFLATLHISDYVSYRDVFHGDEAPSPATATEQA